MTPLTANGKDGARDIRLAVVILTYGASDKVTGLLDHLHAEAIDVPTELIVVHNPSRPGETIRSPAAGDVCPLQLERNLGYVGGMNAGIGLALSSDPEFVLLLTHDVRITAGVVQGLLALMQGHGDLGAIGPVLCGPDGVHYSAGFIRSRGVRTPLRLPTDGMPRPLWPCAALDGSAMLWRAAALAEVRGFDERFFMYFDDVDICTRATRCGWQIAVATELQATSAPGKGNRRSAHAYLRARNSLAYARTFGRGGLLAGLAECAVGLWLATPKPGGDRFGDPEARRLAVTYWRGTLLGMLDYFRGRWGPPSPGVLRDSDIAGT